MKLLTFYLSWTAICVFLLKGALNILFNFNTGYWPAILITLFVQIAILAPVASVISSESSK